VLEYNNIAQLEEVLRRWQYRLPDDRADRRQHEFVRASVHLHEALPSFAPSTARCLYLTRWMTYQVALVARRACTAKLIPA
jgi:hypothetical protein